MNAAQRQLAADLWIKPIGYWLKDDRQRFLQKVSKKQFRTVYYNANARGWHKWMNNIAKC